VNITAAADPDVLSGLLGRSLLLTDDYTTAELAQLLGVAERFSELDRAGKKVPLLPHELAYALFFDNSTRTKSAWAGAAARLGMHPVIVDGSSTQVSHGETAAETGAMLGMNAHALGVRHDLILGEGNAFMRDVKRGSTTTLRKRATGAGFPSSTSSATSTIPPRRWPTSAGSARNSPTASKARASPFRGPTHPATPSPSRCPRGSSCC
jgi:hypothetical protein